MENENKELEQLRLENKQLKEYILKIEDQLEKAIDCIEGGALMYIKEVRELGLVKYPKVKYTNYIANNCDCNINISNEDE